MAGSVEDFDAKKLDHVAADLAKTLHIPADHLKATVTAGSVVVHFFFKGEGTHGIELVKELESDFKKGDIGNIGGISVKGIEPSFEPKPDSKKAGADAYQAAVKAGASSKAAAAAAAAAVAAVKEDASMDQAKAAGAAAAAALKAALAAGSSGDAAAAAAKAAGAAAAQGANASKAAEVAKAAAKEFKKAVASGMSKGDAANDAEAKSLKAAGLKVPKGLGGKKVHSCKLKKGYACLSSWVGKPWRAASAVKERGSILRNFWAHTDGKRRGARANQTEVYEMSRRGTSLGTFRSTRAFGVSLSLRPATCRGCYCSCRASWPRTSSSPPSLLPADWPVPTGPCPPPDLPMPPRPLRP